MEAGSRKEWNKMHEDQAPVTLLLDDYVHLKLLL